MSTHGIMGTLSKHQKPSFWHGLKPPHYKPSKNPVQNPASSGPFLASQRQQTFAAVQYIGKMGSQLPFAAVVNIVGFNFTRRGPLSGQSVNSQLLREWLLPVFSPCQKRSFLEGLHPINTKVQKVVGFEPNKICTNGSLKLVYDEYLRAIF
jgi:hypothetical protein